MMDSSWDRCVLGLRLLESSTMYTAEGRADGIDGTEGVRRAWTIGQTRAGVVERSVRYCLDEHVARMRTQQLAVKKGAEGGAAAGTTLRAASMRWHKSSAVKAASSNVALS